MGSVVGIILNFVFHDEDNLAAKGESFPGQTLVNGFSFPVLMLTRSPSVEESRPSG